MLIFQRIYSRVSVRLLVIGDRTYLETYESKYHQPIIPVYSSSPVELRVDSENNHDAGYGCENPHDLQHLWSFVLIWSRDAELYRSRSHRDLVRYGGVSRFLVYLKAERSCVRSKGIITSWLEQWSRSAVVSVANAYRSQRRCELQVDGRAISYHNKKRLPFRKGDHTA